MHHKLVIGIGGAGCYLASQIQKNISCDCLTIDRAGHFNGDFVFSKKIEISEKYYDGSVLNDSYKAILLDDIQNNLKDASVLVLAIGLGGYLGTTLGIELAKRARNMGMKIIAVVYMPFAFETSRHKTSQNAFTDLRACVDELVIHDHATQLTLPVNASRSMLDYFIAAGESMVNHVNGKLLECNA